MMRTHTSNLPLSQPATAGNSGDSGDKPAKPNNGGALQPIRQWGQSGDEVGAKWGHFYMMKLNSINLSICLAPNPAATCPASGFVGSLCTSPETGAKGIPLAQHHPAADLVEAPPKPKRRPRANRCCPMRSASTINKYRYRLPKPRFSICEIPPQMHLWITFAAPAFCELLKKQALWIRFASG